MQTIWADGDPGGYELARQDAVARHIWVFLGKQKGLVLVAGNIP